MSRSSIRNHWLGDTEAAGRPAALVLYQRHWHVSDGAVRDEYLTAALYRGAAWWVVVAVDGDVGGGYEVTTHDRLEDAREAAIAWVGAAREIGPERLPATVRRKLERWLRTGDLESD